METLKQTVKIKGNEFILHTLYPYNNELVGCGLYPVYRKEFGTTAETVGFYTAIRDNAVQMYNNGDPFIPLSFIKFRIEKNEYVVSAPQTETGKSDWYRLDEKKSVLVFHTNVSSKTIENYIEKNNPSVRI